MKTLLILENDSTIERIPHSHRIFIDEYEGDVVEMTGLSNRKEEEIYKAVVKCTDIICYSMLVNGSEYQLQAIADLLAKVPESKNVYMTFYEPVKEELDRFLTVEQKSAMQHHRLYEIDRSSIGDMDPISVYFTEEVKAYDDMMAKEKKIKEAEEKFGQEYRDSSKTRVIGKVKIIGCMAVGEEFKALKIGKIVDRLDMSKTDPRPPWGVWVWGKTEPVKLINDSQMREFEIMNKVEPENIFSLILREISIDESEVDEMVALRLTSVINTYKDSNHTKAHYICDKLNIPRRHNRALIRDILDKQLT